jgi:hypothetical protein
MEQDMQTMHMGHQPMIWLIDENHARGVFQYEDHMCYYDDCEVLQSWMVYCDDFVKGEDGKVRYTQLVKVISDEPDYEAALKAL